MKLQDISLFESYSTAKQVFAREASPEEVGKRLDQFKALNQRNMLKPEERDLGKWIRSGWEAFSSFVADASSRTSGKSEKKAKKSDSIKVHENDNWLVVVPLSKNASCFYGRDTQWCTAATKSQNYFDKYFFDDNITLMYFIHKKSGEKMAIARSSEDSRGRYRDEVFDKEDSHIELSQLCNTTGFSEAEIEKWFESVSPATAHERGVEEPKRKAAIIADAIAKLNELGRSDPRLVVVSSEGEASGYYFPRTTSSAEIEIMVYGVDESNGDMKVTNHITFAEMIDNLHGLDSHPEALKKVIEILRGYSSPLVIDISHRPSRILEWLAFAAALRMEDVADTLRQRGVTSKHPEFVEMTNSRLMHSLYKAYDLGFALQHIPEFKAKMHEVIKGLQKSWDESI